MDEGYLGGVADPGEHRLAGEQTTHGHSVQSTRQGPLVPDLDAVDITQVVKPGIGGDHVRGDPDALAGPVGAAGNDRGEIAVEGDLEAARAHGTGQPAGDV